MTATAEFVTLAALTATAPEWADLCADAEPNPFAEPGFLLPLIAYERPKRLRFAQVRRAGRLIGFAALIAPRVGLARAWMSAYAALPACAFQRGAEPEALAALIGLLATTRLVGVVWPLVETDGPLAVALRSAGAALPLEVRAGPRRAALRLAGPAAFEASLNPRRRTKWARQGRKLASFGRLEEQTGAAAVEAFFELEGKGWKGARRSALADDPARLTFARAALDAFARTGRLDAMTLRLDGKAIAAGLAPIAGARAFYWKTTYDEAFADTSPGVQLTLAHSRRLAATPGLTLVDSCAAEDHPMIGRVWGESIAFEEIAIGLRVESGGPMRLWLWLAAAKSWAREQAKSWAQRTIRR